MPPATETRFQLLLDKQESNIALLRTLLDDINETNSATTSA